MYFLGLVNNLLDLIFPRKCVGCGIVLDSGHLCRKCFKLLPVRTALECVGCKRPMREGETCRVCRRTHSLDNLYIASDYKDKLLKRVIEYHKYRFIHDLAEPLSILVRQHAKKIYKAKKISPFLDLPIIIPIPLHRRRHNFRGFNQSELIAANVAKSAILEMRNDILIRTGSATPQAQLENREARLKNITNCFQCINSELIRGRSILLIDDVCTTGATLNECAKVLKASGAKKVSALVIARG